jgi:hypothetical protein
MINRKFIARFLFLFTLLTLLTFKAFSQNKIYVNINASGANDGTSWSDAFQQLQPAINAAIAGDSIWVAAGTYYPTVAFDADSSGSTLDREKTFYIDKNITIHGQFQGVESLFAQRNKAHQTILSGDLGIPQDTTDNAFHVVYIDGTTSNGAITNNTVLDGFSIEQGQATGINFPNNSGAGIFNNGQSIGSECSPSFKNLILQYNSAYQGGAIYNTGSLYSSTSLLIDALIFNLNNAQYGAVCYTNSITGVFNILFTNSTFTNNSNSMDGGIFYTNTDDGITTLIITDSYFENNRASSGAVCYNNIDNSGSLSINFDDNTVKNNVNQVDGGIIYTLNNNQGNYTLIAENNTFHTNNATRNGAIFFTNNSNSSSNLNVNNNLFEDNIAYGSGGVFYNTITNNSTFDLQINDNKFTSNMSLQDGGVVYNKVESMSVLDMSFTNNTVEGCGSINGGVIYNKATNSTIDHLFEKNFVIFSNVDVPSSADGGVIFQEGILRSTTSLLSNSNSYISNTVDFRGGAIFNRSDSSTATVLIINDIFARNSSGNFGGAICNDILNSGALNTTIANSSFLDQQAGVGNSILIYNQNLDTTINIITNVGNSIFWQSQSSSIFVEEIETSDIPVTLNNCIYFDDNIDGVVSFPSWISGTNNQDLNPLFTNTSFGDLTLQSTSPAIDLGNNNAIPIAFITDHYGSPRINNSTIDIGATEYFDSLIISNQQFNSSALCNGDSGLVNIILLGGTAPYSINGVPSSFPIPVIYLNNVAGSYQFNVVDANGLSKNVSVVLTEPDPLVLSASSFSNGNASVTTIGGTAPYTYQWSDPNLQTGDIATGLTNGTYTVLVTDANGCTEMATVSINLMSTNITIAVGDANTLTVIPNPSSGQFSLNFDLSITQSIQPILYNLQGQIVHEFELQTGNELIYEANLPQLPAGTYILRAVLGEQNITKSIVLY